MMIGWLVSNLTAYCLCSVDLSPAIIFGKTTVQCSLLTSRIQVDGSAESHFKVVKTGQKGYSHIPAKENGDDVFKVKSETEGKETLP